MHSNYQLSINGGENTFINNVAQGGDTRGGAINGAEVTLADGTFLFEGNMASGDEARGGAIYSGVYYYGNGHHPSGSFVKADNASFLNNHAFGSGYGAGGAIYSAGYVELSNSVLSGNSASVYGGAIYLGDINPYGMYGDPQYWTKTPDSVIHNTSITNNHAGVAGGGIYTKGHLTLSADAGKSTVVSGNTAGGKSDGIYMDTSTTGTDNYDKADFTIAGEGTVRIDDSVRAVGEHSVAFNKSGTGSLIWGNHNYFSNNSSFSFNAGKTTLSSDFTLEAQNMSLNLAAEHSLYLDLTNRDRDLAYFNGLGSLNVAYGSSLVLSINGISDLSDEIDLGSWLFADLSGNTLGFVTELLKLELSLLVDGIMYYGAFFEVIDTGVWLNMASLSTTPIPGSVLLLGTGVAALIRMRRRAA